MASRTWVYSKLHLVRVEVGFAKTSPNNRVWHEDILSSIAFDYQINGGLQLRLPSNHLNLIDSIGLQVQHKLTDVVLRDRVAKWVESASRSQVEHVGGASYDPLEIRVASEDVWTRQVLTPCLHVMHEDLSSTESETVVAFAHLEVDPLRAGHSKPFRVGVVCLTGSIVVVVIRLTPSISLGVLVPLAPLRKGAVVAVLHSVAIDVRASCHGHKREQIIEHV